MTTKTSARDLLDIVIINIGKINFALTRIEAKVDEMAKQQENFSQKLNQLGDK